MAKVFVGGREAGASAVTPPLFGDGGDGDVTISTETTLTQDMYYDNLTVNAGVELKPDGYKIFVRNTLTLNGQITNNGGAGGNGGANGSGGSAGAKTGEGSLGNGGDGATGGAGGTGNGTVGSTAGNITTSLGGDAKDGATGGDGSGGTGGAFGSAGSRSNLNAAFGRPSNFVAALFGKGIDTSPDPIRGGGARGGGAGGGVVILVTMAKTNPYTLDVSGGLRGTGGTGSGTGTDGGSGGLDGLAGNTYVLLGV